MRDITGQRFERLTVLYPLKERSKKRYVIWHCRCDCGNEADFSYNVLMYSNLKSCGCAKRAHDKAMPQYPARVDGTALDRFKSSRVNRNSTTGVRGVYFIRGKYVAKLVFQKRQYYLGEYETLAKAAKARGEAEESIAKAVLGQYAAWKTRADADPDWARENPVQIRVVRNDDGSLRMLFHPEMK